MAEKKDQKKKKIWKNSIVGHDNVDPKTLMPNPENWRLHGDLQSRTMDDVLSEVGWIQQIIVNKTTGKIVDGHLRVKLSIERNEPLVPVTYVELSEDEERKALLTLDPLSGLADADIEQFTNLVTGMDTDSLWIRELMDSTRSKILNDDAEDEKENEEGAGGADEENIPEMELQPFEGYDYVMLIFKNTQDFHSICDKLKIKKVKITHPGGMTKIGMGRVIDGVDAVRLLSKGENNE